MRGIDLYSPAKNKVDIPERTVFYETYPGAAPQVPGAEMMLQKPIWVGLRKGMEKIMFSVRYQRWEQYDIGADPAELDNQANISDPEFISRSETLTSWYKEWENDTVVGEIGVMTAEDIEKFKALGYVDGP